MLGEKRPGVVAQTSEQEGRAGRNKQLERRVQGGNLEDDEQEAQAVPQWFDVALADAFGYRNRLVGHRVRAAEEGHGARGGIGKTIGQQVQELAELIGTHGAETGCQIHHLETRDATCQPVVNGIGQTSAYPGLT